MTGTGRRVQCSACQALPATSRATAAPLATAAKRSTLRLPAARIRWVKAGCPASRAAGVLADRSRRRRLPRLGYPVHALSCQPPQKHAQQGSAIKHITTPMLHDRLRNQWRVALSPGIMWPQLHQRFTLPQLVGACHWAVAASLLCSTCSPPPIPPSSGARVHCSCSQHTTLPAPSDDGDY